MAKNMNFTTNLAADFFDRGGWGRHARSFAVALNKQTPVALCNINPDQRPDHRPDGDAVLPAPLPPDPEGLGIALGPLEWLPSIVGRRRISFAVWETTRVPEDYLHKLRSTDQVWVPTHWGRQLFERAGLDPAHLRVVPEGVDPYLFVPAATPRNPEPFRFLSIGKWEKRKGSEDLVRAFCTEFKRSEPVELVMHAHNPYLGDHLDLQAEITHCVRDLGNDLGRVVLSPPKELPELIRTLQSCDAFVLPTRAEGWGLPILEAMACGLPCIVTDYSGHRAFANEDNAYLISVERMCAVDDPQFFSPDEDWGEWAQPDLAHLRHLMRHVYTHREEAAARGQRARRDAVRQWTWDHAAEIALRRLEEIHLTSPRVVP